MVTAMAEIKSINELLKMDLDIPDYQRPYKWSIQNIEDLLTDITNAIADSERYRDGFDEDVQRSLQAGLNAHLSKPVKPEQLYQTLEEFIGKTEGNSKA